MKCQSCEEEVPSKFQYAIATNCCPLCGQQIMEPELQKILSSLREVMAEAASMDYQPAAFDWLHSNFKLISTDGDEYRALQEELTKVKQELQEAKEKYTKPVPRSGKANSMQAPIDSPQMGVDDEGHAVQLEGDSIQDPERTQLFMNRASAAKMNERNNHFKKIVNQIKKSGTVSSSGNGDIGIITPEMIMAASPEEVEEMEAMLSGGLPNVASSISSDYDDDELPPIAESLIAMGSGKQSADYNAKDVAALQKLQSKSAHAAKALDRGGSIGLIRR